VVGSAILVTQIIIILLCSFVYANSKALIVAGALLFLGFFIYSLFFEISRKLADLYAVIFVIVGIVVSLYGVDLSVSFLSFLTSLFLILYPYPDKVKKRGFSFRIKRTKSEEKFSKDGESYEYEYEYLNPYNLTPEEFKRFVEDLLNKLGYKIEKVLNFQENGFDMIVTGLENKRMVLMVRRYRGYISTKLLQRLFEIMLEENADGGIFITTSDFSSSSYRLSESKPIKLINGSELSKLSKDLLKIILEI